MSTIHQETQQRVSYNPTNSPRTFGEENSSYKVRNTMEVKSVGTRGGGDSAYERGGDARRPV